MTRRTRAVEHGPDHSLATHVEALDAEYNERRASTTRLVAELPQLAADAGEVDAFVLEGVLGPLGAWATEHARREDRPGMRGNVARDRSARWRDELAVIRFLALAGSPRARGRGVGGELGRAGQGGGPSTSASAYEPRIDDHHAAAWRVWSSLDDLDQVRLAQVFASLGGGTSATSQAREIREGLRQVPEGVLVEAAKITPALLVALGEGPVGGTAEEQVETGRVVARQVSRARRRLREGLREVELDTRPALLIPAPTLAELERENAVDVQACAGVLVVDGLRAPCEGVDVHADVSSWPRCTACGRPVLPVGAGS